MSAWLWVVHLAGRYRHVNNPQPALDLDVALLLGGALLGVLAIGLLVLWGVRK